MKYHPDAMKADAADDSSSEELFEAAKIALTHGMSLPPPMLTNGNIRLACFTMLTD
jgi:hypothetical protein